MRRRKIPLRKCVACQEMKSKKELIRVVRTPEGEIMIDLLAKNPDEAPIYAEMLLASSLRRNHALLTVR